MITSRHHRALRLPADRCCRPCITAVALLLVLAGCGDDGEPAAARLDLDPNPPLIIGAAQQRPAQVVLPGDYRTDRQYPLVILLHGFGANAAAQDFIFGLAQRVDHLQFVLVLPEGTQNQRGQQFWNAFPECCNFTASPVDDVGYLAALMREAMQTYAIDARRVRLVGHSNGGYMAYRFACERPVPIDRIAVLAGSTSIEAEDCRNPAPIDVLHLHGTRDDTVPYDRNLPPDGGLSGIVTIGAEATVARWAAIAGCAAAPILVERRDHQLRLSFEGDPAESDILRYPACRDDHSIELWRANGGDHIYLRANDLWRDQVARFLAE